MNTDVISQVYQPITGHLKEAILSLSGKYKILISDNLWFSDYSGRMTQIDLTKSIIPQLCTFLSTPSPVRQITSYGAQNMIYHLPTYIQNSQDITSLLVLKVKDKPYPKDELVDLLRESTTILLHDLNKNHVCDVIDEILRDCPECPVVYDNKNNKVIIQGLNYATQCWVTKELILPKETSNGEYVNIINQLFEDNNIIYPHFINFEVPFTFTKEQNTVDFGNFYAFLSHKTYVPEPNIIQGLPDDSKVLKVYEYSNKYVDVNFDIEDTLRLTTWPEKDSSVIVKDIQNQPWLYKVRVTNLTTNDIIHITNKGTDVLKYKLSQDDIKSSTWQTLSCLSIKLQYLTNYGVHCRCSLNDEGMMWYFESSSQYEYHFYTGSKESTNIIPTDRVVGEDIYYLSMNIKSCDIATDYDIDAAYLVINNWRYKVVKEFTYDSRHIVRLNQQCNIKYNTPADIYNYYTERFISFTPIPLLGCPVIESVPLYNFDEYSRELGLDYYVQRYPSPIQGDGLNKKLVSQFVYMNGTTSFSTLNTINSRSVFGDKNGALERFGYFLIPTSTPDYALSGVRYNLWYDTTPRMWSRFYKASPSTCECVFMGVKYSADIKYLNYKFAVSLVKNRDYNLPYLYCDINDIDKEIVVYINRNFSFYGVDKIDVSLFYNINSNFRLSQQHREDYMTCGLKFGHMITTKELQDGGYDDFIVNDEFVVIRDKSSVDYLNDIITRGETFTLYDFADEYVDERGNVVSFAVYEISFVNCHDIRPNSMICSDIVVRMMMGECDDKTGVVSSLFMPQSLESTLHDVTQTNISFSEIGVKYFHQRYSHKVDNWQNVYMTRFFQSLKNGSFNYQELIEPVSLRKEYFRITYRPKPIRVNIYSIDNTDIRSLSLSQVQSLVDNKYLTTERTERLTKNNEPFILDLFDTNKWWDIIQHYVMKLYTDRMSETSLTQYVEQFSINTFKTFIDNNLIPIHGSNKSLKLNIIEPSKNIDGLMRYNTVYYPFFGRWDDIVECEGYRELHTLFMKDFSAVYQGRDAVRNMSATSLWQEISDIISTQFVGTDYEIPYTSDSLDFSINDVLRPVIIKDQFIINHENTEFLRNVTGDPIDYLIDSYTSYILKEYYTIHCISHKDKRVPYTFDGVMVHCDVQGDLVIYLKRKK